MGAAPGTTRAVEQTAVSSTALKPKRRRWYQISLRLFLVVFTIVCLVSGGFTNQVIWQKQAVELVRFHNGALGYEFENYHGGILRSGGYRTSPAGEPRGPAWLRERLGVDFFNTVVQVDCARTDLKNLGPIGHLTRLRHLHLNESAVADIKPLANLRRLEILELRSLPISDLSPLSGMRELEYLQLSHTNVCDLEPLRKLTNLEQLYLHGTQVEDISVLAGLPQLKYVGLNETMVVDISPLLKLQHLKWVGLRGSPVSPSDCRKLRDELPLCTVEHESLDK